MIYILRSELTELHYITPIENIPSIIRNGILSHRRAKRLRHKSVALKEVQERRKDKRIPNGQKLHDYVNLYINARNPMMYKRKIQHQELCVLRINNSILDLNGVIIADQNAASNYVAFYPSPEGLRRIDREMVFSEYWTHPDNQITEWRHKSVMCAEVLVLDRVSAEYIAGAYVSCRKALQDLTNIGLQGNLEISERMFFI